jgi:integrase
MAGKLTDKAVKAAIKEAATTGKGRKHSDGGGLYLETTATGAGYWRWKFRHLGKENRLSFGTYPDTALSEARQKHAEGRKVLEQGQDPSQARKAAKITQAITASNTFEAIALEWVKVKATEWAPGHTVTINARLKNNLLPYLGSRPLSELAAPELLAVLKRVESRGAVESAHRCKMIIKQVFDYAIATGAAVINPAQSLGKALATPTERHHPAITDPVRFGELLRMIDGYRGSPPVRAALLIHAMTFQRPGEIQGMQWAEIDLSGAVWTVPPERMKGTRKQKATSDAHIIPLSRQAVAVLRDLHPLTGHRAHVFPSERGGGRPMSENTVGAALRSLGIDTRTEHTGHGFRASARTMLAERLGLDMEVIEKQLAHGPRDALGTAYNRTTWATQRRDMMQAWADYLDTLRGTV